jgi:hypothetical protein
MTHDQSSDSQGQRGATFAGTTEVHHGCLVAVLFLAESMRQSSYHRHQVIKVL